MAPAGRSQFDVIGDCPAGCLFATLAIVLLSSGCDDGPKARVDVRETAIIYGDDARSEYFEANDERVQTRLANSVVAIVPKRSLAALQPSPSVDAGTLGDATGLCPGVRFAAQPSAALCTGVLVDWDLVLTAGHCVHVLPLADLAIVFGYYYVAPGQLALSPGDTFDAVEIVDDALDLPGVAPRRDYAWLRLDRRVRLPRQPVPMRMDLPSSGDAITAIGAANGTPLKVIEGGQVTQARADLGYFVANTDTSHGASGGPAFDADMSLVGVLARGGNDFSAADGGCLDELRVADAATGEEEFTYSKQALADLCELDPGASSLCRPDCGEPCQASPLPTARTGCAAVPSSSSPGNPWLLVLGAASVRVARRMRRRAAPVS